METYQRLIIEAIKNWMKRHGGQSVPGFREVTEHLQSIPASFITNYTAFKKRAFKELEKEGFILKYTNDLRTIAMVDDYKVPTDAAEKVADKILGLEGDGIKWRKDEPATIKPPQPDPKPDKPKPPFLLIVNQIGIRAKDCDGIGKMLQAVAGLSGDIVADIQIRVKKKAEG
jgi:hypothetical protein